MGSSGGNLIQTQHETYLGGGATRSLPRDGGVVKLHGDPTVGPRPNGWTRGQKWK